jgi:hypothetical protein
VREDAVPQRVESTLHFVEDATFIDDVVRRLLPPIGISVVDLSGAGGVQQVLTGSEG